MRELINDDDTMEDDVALRGLALAHAEARMEERLQLAAARRRVRDARAGGTRLR
jgi:hypothetical protein